MRAIHIVAHVGNEASGPSYSVPALGRALGRSGCDVTLLTQLHEPILPSQGFRNQSFSEFPIPHGLRWSPGLGRALLQKSADADVIHNNGLWLAPNIASGFVARRTGKPLIVAPRGSLAASALERSRWKKKVAWPLQKVAIEQADCFHATAEKEYEEIRAFGLTAPVAVIPNGIDLPELSTVEPREERTLLFLGRIHPIKGLDLLLQVWRDLPTATKDGWRLRLVGKDENGHQTELEAFAAKHDLTDVDFVGPAWNAAKTGEYASADLYVLPTKTENFGMTVAEALASGTPVITTKGAPWAGLEENDCGWWVDRSHGALRTALVQAMEKPPEELERLGANGRNWVREAFGWDRIAEEMTSVYSWVADGKVGPPPGCVRTD
ncbi:MAG: glycosyltransferase [Pseudomonadota bacterium]